MPRAGFKKLFQLFGHFTKCHAREINQSNVLACWLAGRLDFMILEFSAINLIENYDSCELSGFWQVLGLGANFDGSRQKFAAIL